MTETKRKEKAKLKKEITKSNKNYMELRKFEDSVSKSGFDDKLDSLISKRDKELQPLIENYINAIADGKMPNELKTISLSISLALSKPLIKKKGFATDIVLTESDYQLSSDYYWDKVTQFVSSGIMVVPTLQQYCGMIGISIERLKKDYFTMDDVIRFTIDKIRDKFVDYYTQAGMLNQVNAVMSVFILKSQFGMKEEAQQQVIQHKVEIIGADRLKELENKYKEVKEDTEELPFSN